MIETVELAWRFGTIEVAAPDRYIRPAIELTGEYSGDEIDLYQALLRPGDVAVDVGANIGVLSIAMGRAVGPTGRLLAFEPQRLVFDILNRNLARHGLDRAETHRAILAEQDGDGAFADLEQLPEGRKVNFGSFSVRSRIQPEYGSMVPTPIRSLDSFGLERCDFIKIDVEGAEGAVLQGASATIARARPVLSVECDRPNATYLWVDAFLRAGYKLWRFRGRNMRVTAARRSVLVGVPNYTTYMVLAVPRERVELLERTDQSRLQRIDDRETLEALTRALEGPPKV